MNDKNEGDHGEKKTGDREQGGIRGDFRLESRKQETSLHCLATAGVVECYCCSCPGRIRPRHNRRGRCKRTPSERSSTVRVAALVLLCRRGHVRTAIGHHDKFE